MVELESSLCEGEGGGESDEVRGAKESVKEGNVEEVDDGVAGGLVSEAEDGLGGSSSVVDAESSSVDWSIAARLETGRIADMDSPNPPLEVGYSWAGLASFNPRIQIAARMIHDGDSWTAWTS